MPGAWPDAARSTWARTGAPCVCGSIDSVQIVILVSCAIAALAVLAGVVLVVVGRGGAVGQFEADYPPLDLPADRPISAGDLGALRLPLSLWGYHVRAVDETLDRLSASVRERDRRIAALESQLVSQSAAVPFGAAPPPPWPAAGVAPMPPPPVMQPDEGPAPESSPISEESPGAQNETEEGRDVPESPSEESGEPPSTPPNP